MKHRKVPAPRPVPPDRLNLSIKTQADHSPSRLPAKQEPSHPSPLRDSTRPTPLFSKYDISYQKGQEQLVKSGMLSSSNLRSKSYTQYYSRFNRQPRPVHNTNVLPKLAIVSNNKATPAQNQMMKNALRQLRASTQLLKKVYGIPDMSFIFQQPHQGALYLGNYFAAKNIEELKKKDIGAVLTVAKMLPVEYRKEDNIDHLVIQALDADFQNLSQFFDETNAFIDQALIRKKNVLVHCAAGVSRSTTCTLAYMLSKHRKTLHYALHYVKQQRKIVNPNPGFIAQLRRYEQTLMLHRK